MGKPIFFTENVKNITDQWLKEEITYGRMIELLNETVEKHIVNAFDEGKKNTNSRLTGKKYFENTHKIWKR